MSQVEVDKIIPQSGTTLTIGDSGDTITIASGATLSGSLNADNLDSGTVPDARITGAYTGITNLTMSGDLTVDTNTLKVDSTNNRVGIGTSSPQGNLSVEGEGRIVTIGDSGTTNVPEIRSRNSTDTGNSFLRISSYSTQFYTEGTQRMYIDSNGKIGINTNSASQALDVIGSIEVSDGIYIGGTAAANKLDDYEEGTWTPTYTGSTTNPTVAYLTQDGTYTKIGNRVYITCTISTSSVTSAGSGQMRVSGLPFASNEVGGGVSVTGNNDWGTNNYPSMGQIFTGESYVALYRYDTSPQTEFITVDASSLGSGSNDNLVRFFGSYITT